MPININYRPHTVERGKVMFSPASRGLWFCSGEEGGGGRIHPVLVLSGQILSRGRRGHPNQVALSFLALPHRQVWSRGRGGVNSEPSDPTLLSPSPAKSDLEGVGGGIGTQLSDPTPTPHLGLVQHYKDGDRGSYYLVMIMWRCLLNLVFAK